MAISYKEIAHRYKEMKSMKDSEGIAKAQKSPNRMTLCS